MNLLDVNTLGIKDSWDIMYNIILISYLGTLTDNLKV